MKKARYNRKIKFSLSKMPFSTEPQKQLLASTHLHLTNFQLSKSQICGQNSSKYKYNCSPQKQFRKSINQIINREKTFKGTNDYSMFTRTQQRNYSCERTFATRNSYAERDKLTEFILLKRSSFKQDDSFPQINAKQFNKKKLDKIRNQNSKNEDISSNQRVLQTNNNKIQFQPWQFPDQQTDFSKL